MQVSSNRVDDRFDDVADAGTDARADRTEIKGNSTASLYRGKLRDRDGLNAVGSLKNR